MCVCVCVCACVCACVCKRESSPHRGTKAGGEESCRTVVEVGGKRVPVTSRGGPVGTGPVRQGGRPERPSASPLCRHWPGTCPAGHGSPCDIPPEMEGEESNVQHCDS